MFVEYGDYSVHKSKIEFTKMFYSMAEKENAAAIFPYNIFLLGVISCFCPNVDGTTNGDVSTQPSNKR